MDRKLLTLEEFCEYLGIGKTKAREMLNDAECTYVVRIGNRLYANKVFVDKWLDSITGCN